MARRNLLQRVVFRGVDELRRLQEQTAKVRPVPADLTHRPNTPDPLTRALQRRGIRREDLTRA